MIFPFQPHERKFPRAIAALAAFVFFALQFFPLAAAEPSQTYGLNSLAAAKAYLQMPKRATDTFPRLLSQTGAFADVRNFLPADTLIPYNLIVPFW
jgi:hypothetical protein